MFLKTLELISTFHPYLSAGQLLEVERKMAIIKKDSFRKVGNKIFRQKSEIARKRKKKIPKRKIL